MQGLDVTALGGGEAAQQLARSMQGVRSGDGSIDPTLLTGALNSYNSYIKSLIAGSQATQKPASELDTLVQTLPPGQKSCTSSSGQIIRGCWLEILAERNNTIEYCLSIVADNF